MDLCINTTVHGELTELDIASSKAHVDQIKYASVQPLCICVKQTAPEITATFNS